MFNKEQTILKRIWIYDNFKVEIILYNKFVGKASMNIPYCSCDILFSILIVIT